MSNVTPVWVDPTTSLPFIHSQPLAQPNAPVTGDTGAKTASFNSAKQINPSAKGCKIQFDIGAVTGTSPTLVAKLQYSSDGGQSWIDLEGASTPTINATGKYTLTVAPGHTASANSVASVQLPTVWRIAYTIGGSSPSFTFNSVQVTYLN